MNRGIKGIYRNFLDKYNNVYQMFFNIPSHTITLKLIDSSPGKKNDVYCTSTFNPQSTEFDTPGVKYGRPKPMSEELIAQAKLLTLEDMGLG